MSHAPQVARMASPRLAPDRLGEKTCAKPHYPQAGDVQFLRRMPLEAGDCDRALQFKRTITEKESQ
jgi:hypothetical protein